MNGPTLRAFGLGVVLAVASPAAAQKPAVSPDEARAIAVDAYLYFYPLLSMDLTRLQMSNIEAGKEPGRGPMNAFHHFPAFPPADMRVVVRPNFDTLYSIAWLDVTREPVVLSAPDTGDRYYLLPMLDMWSDVFDAPGWRTTGTTAASFLVTPAGWQGAVPAGMSRIVAPTPYVWIIGRTKTDGPADYDAVHKIQAGYEVVPLSQWGKPAKAATVAIDPAVDMKTPPKIQVDTMPADKYFAYAAELLKVNPPHATDGPILARMRRIGIEAGRSFSWATLDPAVQKAIAAAPKTALKLMQAKVATLARVVNGWSMNTDTMGVYGNYYLKRAIIAQVGLGANLPEDAIYPLNLVDDGGKTLDGASRYTIHFEKSQLPPVRAFWSVTLYDGEGFQVPNALDRFAVSSWMPFVYNDDGSLDLYFQNESPGRDLEANWLPAPKGPFNLTLRLYSPMAEVLTGKWNPPVVTKETATTVTAQ
ncbi:MAG: DUF1254 domain-containing protein [Vicinamibacteria bacterium]